MSFVVSESPLSATVKAATAALHAELENLMRPRLSSIKSGEDYAALLKMFFGFYGPLENSIHRHITQDLLPDIHGRQKTSLLQEDLNTLGLDTQQIPICFSLPQINNSAAAFGALYVLEGSTLGGRIITRMLLQNDAVPREALRFFSGYGEATGGKWKTFLQALNSQAQQPETITGANDTFYYLKNWMQKTL